MICSIEFAALTIIPSRVHRTPFMRDNAGTMDSLRQARTSQANSMTAVDDLKSYSQIADAHADGIRKLTPAFQALYDSMSDVQKKNADLIFQTDHHHAAKKG